MMVTVDIHDLIKLGIAAIFGLIIGLEREIRNKPLGLKTSSHLSKQLLADNCIY